jgi:hypothetical protein
LIDKEDAMIRRITRRRPRRQSEPRKGAALERRIDLWPFLLAALVAAAAVTAVEPKLEATVEAHALAERQTAAGSQMSARDHAGLR